MLKIPKTFVLLFTLLISAVLDGFSQGVDAVNNDINSVFKSKQKIHKFPFSAIEVIDSRIDTESIYLSYIDGDTPVSNNFHGEFSNLLSNYFKEAVGALPADSPELVIKVNQLRIPNFRCIVKEMKNKRLTRFPIRDYILFSADAFYKRKGNSYRHFLTFQKRYYYYTTFINSNFKKIFHDLIKTISKSGRTKDKFFWYNGKPFHLIDSNLYMEVDLKKDPQDRWKEFPIFANANRASGWCQTFKDFRDNRLSLATFLLRFDAVDSVYHLSPDSLADFKNAEYPWAISFNGNLYIKIFRLTYLKLIENQSVFFFYIPYSLPGMYKFAAFEEWNWFKSITTYSPVPGYIFDEKMDVGVDEIRKVFHAAEKKLSGQEISGRYRKCYIDMDSGDIVF